MSRRLGLWIGFAACLACAPAKSPAPRPTESPASPPDAAQATAPSRAEVVAGSDLPKLVPVPLSGDPMAVTVHRLSNGMTVYISENHEKPRVTAWVGVRAGGRMDPAHSTGLAHYLEHMLFKGSDEFGTTDAQAEAPHIRRVAELYRELRETKAEPERLSILQAIDKETQAAAAYAIPNEIDRMYSVLGISGVNAFTSADATVYIGDVPANRLDAWSQVEVERFADPVFRLFLPELEAVYEEKNLSLDNPYRRVWDATTQALFPTHPYGTQDVLGEVEHLKSPAYADMVEFFGKWYVPNNMAIALAGDIDAKSALPKLEQAFGRLEPRRVAAVPKAEITPPTERKAVEVLAPGTQSVSMSWLLPPPGHPDEVALSILDRLLRDGNFGLLPEELGLTQKVADVGCFLSPYNEATIFSIGADAKDGQSLEEVEALVRGVVERLRKGGFEEADVEAAKLQERIAQSETLEGNEGRASKMMEAFTERMDWADVVARDASYAAVTRNDVMRVANAYLGDAYVIVSRRQGQPEIPKLGKPAITPISIDAARRSAFAERIEALPAAALQPEWAVEGQHYVHRKLESGPLIAVQNRRNDLFALTYEFTRGYAKEPLLCIALELLEVSGAGHRTPAALQRELYQLGVRINATCDSEYSRLFVSGPDASLERALALLVEWLGDPRFSAEDLEKLERTVLTRRKSHLEEDVWLTRALDGYAKFGGRSAWLKHPSNKDLEKARPAKIRSLLRGVMDYSRRVLYFGPRAAEAVALLVDRAGRFRNPGAVWIRDYAAREVPTVLFLHKDGAKANVQYILPQPPLPRPERPMAELLGEYLSGGMSSLVFQEIRESRGLAYSAFARYAEPSQAADETALVGSLSTQADKTPEASAAFIGLLQHPPIAGPRMLSAKQALDQHFRSSRIDPRELKWWVAAWDDLGEPKDPRPETWAAIEKAELETLQAFAERVGQATPTIAVVGDRGRIDLGALEQLGRVIEVSPAELFSYGRFKE